MYRTFLNFAKSCILSCLSKFDIKKKFQQLPFLKYKRLKLKLMVFLAVHSAAMVIYCVTKMILTRSPVTGQFCVTMTVELIDKEW